MDTVRFTVKAERFGKGSGMMKGPARLSDATTMWLNPEHGFVTFNGSLPKHFRGSNVEALRISEVGAACRSLVEEAEGLGWFVPWGEPPYGGRLRRLDVAFDLGCDNRSDVLERAYSRLRLARNEKPVLYGRPYESLAVLRVSRGKRWRVAHRAYDKGVEAGDPELEQLRVEMPMSAYRLDKAGARSFDGDLDAAVEAAWDVLDQHGWWSVL